MLSLVFRLPLNTIFQKNYLHVDKHKNGRFESVEKCRL